MTIGNLGPGAVGGTLASLFREGTMPKKQEARPTAEPFTAEIHFPADLAGVVDRDEYIAEQVQRLGHKGAFTVVSSVPHGLGGERIVVEG